MRHDRFTHDLTCKTWRKEIILEKLCIWRRILEMIIKNCVTLIYLAFT